MLCVSKAVKMIKEDYPEKKVTLPCCYRKYSNPR